MPTGGLELPDFLIKIVAEYIGDLSDPELWKLVDVYIPELGDKYDIFDFEWKYLNYKPINESETILFKDGTFSPVDFFRIFLQPGSFSEIENVVFDNCRFTEDKTGSFKYLGNKLKRPKLNLIFENDDVKYTFESCKFCISDFIEVKNITFCNNDKIPVSVATLSLICINFDKYFSEIVDILKLVNYNFSDIDLIKTKLPKCKSYFINNKMKTIELVPLKEIKYDSDILYDRNILSDSIFENMEIRHSTNFLKLYPTYRKSRSKNLKIKFKTTATDFSSSFSDNLIESLILTSPETGLQVETSTIEIGLLLNLSVLKIDFRNTDNLKIKGPNKKLAEIYIRTKTGCNIEICKTEFPNLRKFVICF